MDNTRIGVPFLCQLPVEIVSSTIGFNESAETEGVERNYIVSRLKRRDVSEIQKELNRRFPFSKVQQVFKKRRRKRGGPRNCGLSSEKRRALGINDIPKKSLTYEQILPLHRLWKSYMDGYIGEFDSDRSLEERHEELSQLLWKADYHGAIFKVTKSRCPSLVGIEGILVLETRNFVKLVCRDNTTRSVPKLTCVFQVEIGSVKLEFNGYHFLTKPTERSVKKLRGAKMFEL